VSVLVNLLPDTRQEQQKDARRRHLITAVAVTIWSVCGGILVLLGLYMASQKLVISSLTSEINKHHQELKDTKGLVEALTGQAHLAALPGLYAQRAYLTKFFSAYATANPSEVALNSLSLDSTGALTVTGTASQYTPVSKLAKALEAVNVTIGTGASATNKPYFTEVSIQSATRSNNRVNFTLNAILASEATHGN
jgi:Tfp pilus assembly protein PilN